MVNYAKRFARPVGRKDKDATPTPAEGDYTFALPDFDERSFMRREVSSARQTFVACGVAVIAGLVAWLVGWASTAAGGPWQAGFLPVFASIWVVPRVAVKFGADVDPKDWKQMLGNGFLVFFTALSVWILVMNLV